MSSFDGKIPIIDQLKAEIKEDIKDDDHFKKCVLILLDSLLMAPELTTKQKTNWRILNKHGKHERHVEVQLLPARP